MTVANAVRDTMYTRALDAWHEWNPEWVLDRVSNGGALFPIDEVMRAFMEGYLQGVERKITGGNDE